MPRKVLYSTEPAKTTEFTKVNRLLDCRTSQSLKYASMHGDVSKRSIQLGHMFAARVSFSHIL